jgi:hypothetical protein
VPRLCFLAFAALAGCAIPQIPPTSQGVLVTGARSPIQYRSPLPRDASGVPSPPRMAVGESCVDGFTFPSSPPAVFLGSGLVVSTLPWTSLSVTLGDRGYATALARARDSVAGAQLFDIRADAHVISILSIWTRSCIEVHASAAPKG